MFGFLEKFFIKRIIKKIVKMIPIAEEKLKDIWENHNEEIFDKVVEAIKKAVLSVFKKFLEKEEIKLTEK